MAHSAALRPFGFSQPTRLTIKTERRAGTPIPSDDSDRTVRASNTYRKPRSRRISLSEDLSSPYCAQPCPSPQSRAPAQRPGGHAHGTFPDEDEDDNDNDTMAATAAVPPSRYSAAAAREQKRRPARLQSSRHAHGHAQQLRPTSTASPITPTAIHNLQLRPTDLPAVREDFSQKQLQEQLKEVYSALRRVEDEREKVLSQMKRGRVDQCRVERELEETRRENQRLASRLEEMLKSPKMKSPLSARSDDGWGCSMYDMEAFEGY